MDKVILITGASGGIGRAASIACANKGGVIAVHYNKNKRAAEDTLSELTGEGHDLFQADISNAKEAQNLIENVHAKYGNIDVLVNNVGIVSKQHILEADYDSWQDQWHRVLSVNLIAASNLIFCAVHKMVGHGGGRIVNISSRGAFRGEPMMPWYGASKAGLNALGQSLSQLLGCQNILIYSLAPGFVHAGMALPVLESENGPDLVKQSSLGRAALPEEVAEVISYLSLEAPAYMTGGVIDINGASYLR